MWSRSIERKWIFPLESDRPHFPVTYDDMNPFKSILKFMRDALGATLGEIAVFVVLFAILGVVAGFVVSGPILAAIGLAVGIAVGFVAWVVFRLNEW